MTTSKSFGASLLPVYAFDLVASAASCVSWWILGVVNMPVFIALTLLRGLLTGTYLWRGTRPLRHLSSMQSLATLGDGSVVELDRSLQRLPAQFARLYLASAFLTPLIAVALARVGIPDRLPIASAELLSSVLASLSSAVVVSAMIFVVSVVALGPAHAGLSRELLRRSLRPRRPAASYHRQLMTTTLSLVFACLVGFGAMANKVRIDAVRGQVVAEQLRRVELAAQRSRSQTQPELGLEFVEERQLPESLRARLAREGSPAPLAVFDVELEQVVAAAPLETGRWLLAHADPNEELGLFVALLLGLSAGILGGTYLALRALSALLLDPISELSVMAQRLVAGGELRSLGRLAPRREDELGGLTRSFNELLDMLEELTTAAHAVADGDLRVELERPGDLHDALRAMLGQLHETVSELRTLAVEVSGASHEIQASTRAQEHTAEQQAISVRETSAMVDSLAAGAERINSVAERVQDNAERSLRSNEATNLQLGELDALSAGLGELLELISEIADRSDLLALNGSLEATRAGEAGRSFALVAVEMRRLAERVSGTVADGRTRIEGIADANAGVLESTRSSRQLAKATAEAAREISAVTGAQGRDTELASSASRALAQHIEANAAALSQIRAATEGLHQRVAEVEELSRSFRLRDGASPPLTKSRR